jgi:hypothetical protein
MGFPQLGIIRAPQPEADDTVIILHIHPHTFVIREWVIVKAVFVFHNRVC